MPDRPPIDISGKPKGEPMHPAVVIAFMILGTVVILGGFFLLSSTAHSWRYANRYAAGMAEMKSRNVASMSQLCETFMRPDLVPHIGDENAKGWSDMCLRHAKMIAPYVK